MGAADANQRRRVAEGGDAVVPHLLAYNVLTLVRTHLPARDKRPQSFARTLEVLYQGLLGLAVLPESLSRAPS